MLVAAQKRKHVHTTLREKAHAVKDIDVVKVLGNKDVAAKYSVQKITKPTWVINKDKILSSLEEGQNIRRQKLCGLLMSHSAMLFLNGF